jgi:hypothetical protein
MEKRSEQRKNIRYGSEKELRVDFYYNVETPINFKKTDGAQQKECKYTGVSRNFSTHGVCFKSDVQLKRGDHLSLEVYLPLQDDPVSMEGAVCWSKCSDKNVASNGFITGVQLDLIEGKDVEETIYHDETYDVDWSEVLESVLGRYRVLVEDNKNTLKKSEVED